MWSPEGMTSRAIKTNHSTTTRPKNICLEGYTDMAYSNISNAKDSV